MAKVTKTSGGYEFIGLGAPGKRLVNEFQRNHPSLCIPSSHPDYRFVRLGSAEDNLPIAKLINDVKTGDPETTPAQPVIFRRRRIAHR